MFEATEKEVGRIRVLYEIRPLQETRPLKKTGPEIFKSGEVVELKIQVPFVLCCFLFCFCLFQLKLLLDPMAKGNP